MRHSEDHLGFELPATSGLYRMMQRKVEDLANAKAGLCCVPAEPVDAITDELTRFVSSWPHISKRLGIEAPPPPFQLFDTASARMPPGEISAHNYLVRFRADDYGLL